ncbi:hypothetical protein AJ80_05613 [Polytolypa hystricis UAMH7299]|uniref:Uncharacterized protein n=1 Tax=Polytolypa hystricis (strain UAMH7299) TaxID=1447883 RepID=A0A2B7Y1V1_POLH7|nr:hypothetical protein AJ80_05613 [Polytolypa hystricis UAMH7299]
MSTPTRPYMSNGQMLSSPPLTARILTFIDSAYIFLGLYIVSLFSLDAYSAAQQSRFNIQNPDNKNTNRPRWGSSFGKGGGGGGGGGGGPGGPGGPGSGGGRPGGPPKRIGRVDDVRGPECGSCR